MVKLAAVAGRSLDLGCVLGYTGGEYQYKAINNMGHCLPLYPDPLKKDMLARLARVEGQIRGVAKMLEDGRGSLEVLQQLASAQASLRAVSKTILRNHMECCCAGQSRNSDDTEMYDELMDVLFKFAK